jgi:hypothetical protein
MTAESIIVGFLLAYAALIHQRIVSLKDALSAQPVFTTVFAGFLVFGLVLIAFRSLLLLFESIRTGDPHERNFNAGYDLFLMVIVGSGVYVLMNAVSLLHYAVTGGNVTPPCELVPVRELAYIELGYMIVAGISTMGWVMVSVFSPFWLTGLPRRIQDKRGTLFQIFVFLAIVTTILALADGLQGTEAWPPCSPWMWLLSIVFGLLTAVTLWMLMIPESRPVAVTG